MKLAKWQKDPETFTLIEGYNFGPLGHGFWSISLMLFSYFIHGLGMALGDIAVDR